MPPTITQADFDFVRQIIHQQAAITLDPGKEYLVESRLTPLAAKSGFPTLASMLDTLRRQPSTTPLCKSVVDAMTTNETSFFRDSEPFEVLKKRILPQLMEARSSTRKLRFWCAASSTGQEPYSIIMLMQEWFPQLATWDIEFIASDLSAAVLEKARQGRYSQLEVGRGLPVTFLLKYFQKDGLDWQLKESVRRIVKFQEVNLIKAWPAMPPLDIVFIRNVLIYFDIDTKKRILGRIKTMLRPDGYLFLGGAETTLNLDDDFHRLPVERAGCYTLTQQKIN